MLFGFSLFSCTAPQTSDSGFSFKTEPFVPYKPIMEDIPFSVIDYQDKETRNLFPDWVLTWIKGGEREIEMLAVYRNKYCFVMEQSGTDISTLLRWAKSFNVRYNFQYMIIKRIFQRWTSRLTVSPDIVYGSYFVNMLKSCYDSRWNDVESGGTFWILVHYNNTVSSVRGDETVPREEKIYKILVFAFIDKLKFQNQLTALFDSISFEKTDNSNQINSVNFILRNFWTNF
jgi:hypothetical protein